MKKSNKTSEKEKNCPKRCMNRYSKCYKCHDFSNWRTVPADRR